MVKQRPRQLPAPFARRRGHARGRSEGWGKPGPPLGLLALVGVLSLTPACSSTPGLADPVLTVAPYYAMYKLRGETQMQSIDGVAIRDNGPMGLEQFGAGSRGDDVGGNIELGDGFSGFRLGYYRLDQVSRTPGRLTENWGNLLEDDTVLTTLEMDEFRFNYTAQLFDYTTPVRDADLDLGFGLGGTVAHRRLIIRVQEESAVLREEKAELSDDGVLYATARARAAWRGAALTVDYGYSDDWNLGGDFKGVLQDLEITASYALEYQDVKLFGGWRRSEIPAQGTRGDLRVGTDFLIEGFFLGLGIDF